MNEVRGLLIEKHGVPISDVTPEARLLHDLGVDGDDAAELFHNLQLRFRTDYNALNEQWGDFFNTEGASPKEVLVGCPVLIICAGTAGVLAAYLHLPEFVGWVLALTFFIGSTWLLSRWFSRERKPVTVGGLAQIVRAGRWQDDPSSVR